MSRGAAGRSARATSTLILLALALAGCDRRPPLPVYAEVPPFVLTSETGQEFRSDVLKGKIWVADFIFTDCTGPCPRMSSRMRRIQDEAKGVTLVSFSVDPANDTPEKLAVYARRYRAEPGRWYFLTGSRETIDRLDKAAFKLGNAGLIHSTRFILVDGRGRIRGYYGGSDEDSLGELLAGIKRLAGEA